MWRPRSPGYGDGVSRWRRWRAWTKAHPLFFDSCLALVLLVGGLLSLHVNAGMLVIGAVSTIVVAVFAIWLGVRKLVQVPPPALLRGATTDTAVSVVAPRSSAGGGTCTNFRTPSQIANTATTMVDTAPITSIPAFTCSDSSPPTSSTSARQESKNSGCAFVHARHRRHLLTPSP